MNLPCESTFLPDPNKQQTVKQNGMIKFLIPLHGNTLVNYFNGYRLDAAYNCPNT